MKNGKNKGCQKCAEEHRQLAEWLKELKQIREKQEPCEDCISRKAVLENAINVPIAKIVTEDKVICRKVIFADDIEKLPSVTPQPKIGRWILKRTFPTKVSDEYIREYECSECGRGIRCTESQLINYPYSRCGAKMMEEKE